MIRTDMLEKETYEDFSLSGCGRKSDLSISISIKVRLLS